MNFLISESQSNKIQNLVQELIDFEIQIIKQESEDWGLGEMDELDEISSIDKVLVKKIKLGDKKIIHVDFYLNKERENFDNTLSQLEYGIEQVIPNVELIVDRILY